MARAIRTDRGWVEILDHALTTGNVIMWGGSDFMCSTPSGQQGATGPTGPTGVIGASTVGSAELNSSGIVARTIDSSVLISRHFDSLAVSTRIIASGAITGTTMATAGTGVLWIGDGTKFTLFTMGANNTYLQVQASNVLWSTAAGGAAGGASTQTTTVNWGTIIGQKFKLFSITDADSTTTQRIVGNILYMSTDNKQTDEFEMDSFETKWRALSGSVECAMRSLEGSMTGTVMVSYIRQ